MSQQHIELREDREPGELELRENRRPGELVESQDINQIAQAVNHLASRIGSSILYLAPSVATASDLPTTGDSPGEARIVEDTKSFWVWDGTNWIDMGKVAQGPPGETPDVSTGPVQVYPAVGDVSLVEPKVSTVHALTLIGNVTLTLPSVPAGRACYLTVLLQQDAGGGHSVTWPSSVRWVGGIVASASPGPGVTDLAVMFTVDGGATWLGSLTKGYF